MVLWILLFITLLAAALLLFAVQPVRVELEYHREGVDDRLLVLIRGPFGLIFQRTEIPVADLIFTSSGPGISFVQESQDALRGGDRDTKVKVLLKEVGKVRKHWKMIKETMNRYRPALDYMLEKMYVEAFTWETRLGSTDAAATGMLTGAAWSVKGVVMTVLQAKMHLQAEKTAVMVTPAFYRNYFSTFLHCIFSIRVMHILVVQGKLLKYKLRQKKEVQRGGKPSNSRPNEDSHGKH